MKSIYLDTAIQIGNKICRDAIWAENYCNWITSDIDESDGLHKTFFHSLGPEFYSGTSGIAYFLGSLYSHHNDDIIRSTAYGSIGQALSVAHKINGKNKFGLFSGTLGIAYTSIKLGQVFDDRKLIDVGITLLREILAEPLEQGGLDVIDGYAGAIPVLLKLYDDLQLEECVESALKMGDYLLSVKQREEMGFSWETTPFKKNNLTGFAHGVAGISNALFELFEFSGEEKFKIVAEAGIQYENYFFDKKEQNWPDFRDFNYLRKNENEETPCSCAWCHGAPGIGLSRLRAFEITGNELYKEDAMLAINTTIKNNTIKRSGNFSLCHGLFGNSELLIEASRIFKNNEYLKFAESIGLMGIDLYIKESIPFINGVYNDFENPEFMTGTAGMGYFYLRLFDPEEFPCILSVHLANKSRKQVLKKPIRYASTV